MSATVISRVDFGLFVRLSDGLTSLLPKKYLKGMNIDPNNVPIGHVYDVTIKGINPEKEQVKISLARK